VNARRVRRVAPLVACALLAAASGCRTAPTRFERVSWGEKLQGYVDRGHEFLATCLERDRLARVKPWERNLLAREDMAWEPDSLRSLRRTHIFLSKEGSLVGGGTGGGGCGCN
jgi:hypothetical protein